MKILMVNKFLYPNGGSETYIFKIGRQLQNMGHEVEYFGMEHKDRIVGNSAGSYTSNMDFHTGKLQKLLYPFRILYSREARRKIRIVLEDFQPDVVHLNNFNFQLTPSILYEIKSFAKKRKKAVPIIYTAHDYQWICPDHLLYIPHKREVCERCLGGHLMHCSRNRCIHNSMIKSMLGSMEGYLYRLLKTYRLIDTIICPSEFLRGKLSTNPLLQPKTVTLHNFIDEIPPYQAVKEDYVLYFGRYSEEKGIAALLKVCRSLPDIPFVFAGSGPLEAEVDKTPNVRNIGFQTGDALKEVIAKARFSVFTPEWYENCPFSVIESQTYGTPLVAARIGGTPELVRDGETTDLYESGNAEDLKQKIEALWNDRERLNRYTRNCYEIKFDTLEEYCHKLLELYQQQIGRSKL